MEVADQITTAAALLAGVVVHVLKKVVEKRQSNADFSLVDYLTAYPYQTAVSIMMSVGGYIGLMSTGDLNGPAAFLMGVTANSLAGAAGKGER